MRIALSGSSSCDPQAGPRYDGSQSHARFHDAAYPPANPPMVFSVLAVREVSTWSEEWKHECEIAFLANMPLGKRNETLDG